MLKGFYFITDSNLSRAGNIADVKNAIAAGVGVVQYRDKHKSTKELYKEALELRRICKKVIFLVNDRLDIAMAVGADGLHLGRSDLPYSVARRLLGKDKIIGLTVHTLKQALSYAKLGVNYLGVSPIFATKTKSDAGKPVGLKLIKEIKRRISTPIIAIGGINLSNAAEVINSGADGLCAISAVVTKKNVKAQIKRFQSLFQPEFRA